MTDPVVVIGYGPVGATAALLLARWRVPVLVLEARQAWQPVGSRSICQQRDVLDVWDRLGAGAIAAEGLTWTTARTYWRDRELFAWQFVDPGGSPLPPFVNISQSRTEQLLAQRVAAEPLIEVRWGHEVTGLAQDPAGVTVHCRDREPVRASYVLACPGGRGAAIRAALGVDFPGTTSTEQFLICDIEAELPGWANERRFYFDPPWNPGRQVLIHPCPGSTFRIDWQVGADFDLARERADGSLDRRVRAIIGDRPYGLRWCSVYRFHSRVADRLRVGRVLLAGDAAHLFSPFGARGLNSGVFDAENAAWKLAFVRHGWAPPELLDSYHQERHAAALENRAVTEATMRFLAPPDESARAHRAAVLAGAPHDPQLRAQVDSGRLAEPYWYADSPLTTPCPYRAVAGRPPRGEAPAPAPGVLVPDLPVRLAGEPAVTRLRELVRDGLLLLTAEGVDPDQVAAAARGSVDTAGDGAGCGATTGTTGGAAGGPSAAATLARSAGAAATAGIPVRVLAMAELAHCAGRSVAGVLGARAGEVWLVRPDGHVAATLDHPAPPAVRAAIRRVLGYEQRR